VATRLVFAAQSHIYVHTTSIYTHTTSSKYLDVTIDEYVTWKDHVKTAISEANKVKGIFNSKLIKL